MKQQITLFLLLLTSISFSQIKGTIKDKDGNPLPFVNIYIENTYVGTTSNELGKYELNTTDKNTVHLIFQYLGYKTQKHILNITSFPFEFDVTLQEEDFQLKEVVIVNGENPANEIIRSAITSKKKNAAKTEIHRVKKEILRGFICFVLKERWRGVALGLLHRDAQSKKRFTEGYICFVLNV